MRPKAPKGVEVVAGRAAAVVADTVEVQAVALAVAVGEGRIAGAAVDVFAQEPPPANHPLYRVDNVIVSPHVSGFLASYDDRCAELFAENLRRFVGGEPLVNLVDRAKGY